MIFEIIQRYNFQPYGALLALIISVFFLLVRRKKHHFNGETLNKKAAPEPAGAWPVIGHLLQLGPQDLWHRKLGDMADEVGPAFMIRLGMRHALIVNNSELAKECFTTHDKLFTSRPGSISSKYMGYNGAMLGFAPDGPYMRELRKIATQELFSNQRLHLLKHVRVSEIDLMMKGLNELCYQNRKNEGDPSSMLVHLDPWLDALTVNVMLRTIAGKRYYSGADGVVKGHEESRRWKETFVKLIHVLRTFLVSDIFPALEIVDVMLGATRAMKKASKDMDLLLSRWLEEHRMSKNKDIGEEDFVDVLLNVDENAKLFSEFDVDTVVKATCLDILIAASDSTTLTLLWALSLLLNHRHVLKKVQQELDNQIGKDRHAEEEDIKHLPYLQSVVKETLRLYPPSPLSLPHEATQDCSVGGFHVLKGTSLITNIWKIQRDPNIWADPLEFKPERFLNTSHAHVDFRCLHFELIPFGSGRRMCLGTNLAANIVHLTLARLLHEFELGTPDDTPIDMAESPDVSLNRASPLNVLIAPRLPLFT